MTRRTTGTRSIAVLLVAALAWLVPTHVVGEVNQVTAGIAGLNNGTVLGGDGTGNAQITISGTDLALIKQARDTGGTVLPNGTGASSGTTLYFVLYVDNTTGFAANDVRITDLLDQTAFSYSTGTLEETTVPTGSNDAAIWAGTWVGRSDGVGAPDDIASAVDTGVPAGVDSITAGAVSGQANTSLSIPGSTLWALRFQVTVN